MKGSNQINILLLLYIVFFAVLSLLFARKQNEKITTIMDSIVSLRAEMIASDQLANVESLRSYVGNLEEKLTGERKVFEGAIAEEQRQRQLLLAQGQLSKLEADLEISKLKSNINKLSESDIDLANIVGQWEGRVVRVECNFGITKQIGSGLVFGRSVEAGSVASVITNSHIVLDLFGRAPKSCDVVVSDGSRFTSSTSNGEIEISATDLDFAILTIHNPNSKLASIISKNSNVCQSKASIGDQILILGYPSIGSADSITATDGIISGYEDNYYVTSAKVERGNSGGVAIDIKNNCYLGIPSFVTTGGLESLARILDASKIGIAN